MIIDLDQDVQVFSKTDGLHKVITINIKERTVEVENGKVYFWEEIQFTHKI